MMGACLKTILVRFWLIVGIIAMTLDPLSAAAHPREANSTTIQVVASLAGYSKKDIKIGFVISPSRLSDETFQVYKENHRLATGALEYTGITWGKHVYKITFTSIQKTGNSFTLRSNGASSSPFPIQANVWEQYLDEMTAFYRVQRANVDTQSALPPNYTNTPLSAKGYHQAGHLDDAASPDRTQHYDLTGGWYDAGDYGKYGGNQWVGGMIALSYLRHANAKEVQFDHDHNGTPDLLDEAKVGALYAMKFVDTFGGAVYNIANNAGFDHPEKTTDNIVGTADDRTIGELSIGGSAKAAGMLAATARAFHKAKVDPSFADAAAQRAVIAYNYAYVNQLQNEGSYEAIGGLPNSLLWAEVELYLLTKEQIYKDRAISRINELTKEDLRATNYWDLRPLSLVEFYPEASLVQKVRIRLLLRSRVEYFISMADDTPYGVLDEFTNFGVNEAHMSYIGDLMRYYELFQDPSVLRAAKKGVYWIYGANPWNISWVSGIGANSVKYLHTRLDEQAYDHALAGITIPGALVSGPNIKDTKDKYSVSPWYEDRPLWQDDAQQWRYNEYSISIQVNLLYTMVALAATNSNPQGTGITPMQLPITSPQIGDFVAGDVRVFVQPQGYPLSLTADEEPMQWKNGSYYADVPIDTSQPFAFHRIMVHGTSMLGVDSYSAMHVNTAPDLPAPGSSLLYDDFSGNGTWGAVSLGWPNWYNQDGGTGSFEQTSVDARDVGVFSQRPASESSLAKFEPWKDTVNASGYRYMEVRVKNLSNTNIQARFYAEGGSGYEFSGGYISIPTSWTTLRFDLDQFPGLDKSNIHITLWLKAGTAPGSIAIDNIAYTNENGGGQPTLTQLSVEPKTGTENTNFQFSTTYTDPDNDKPFAVQIIIDGVLHDMVEASASDTNYRDGKLYVYATKLVPGSHRYAIRTADTSTPVVLTPQQEWPQVYPSIGSLLTPPSAETHIESAPTPADDTTHDSELLTMDAGVSAADE
ncbi:hypothetical protein F8S13_02025 [Chloroflexia bacterium SDU3-3]|nr:hypothetical protein F8S13_02025 [Chloroflexia bacterium SDU3-3]